MINGLVSITKEEFSQYFESNFKEYSRIWNLEFGTCVCVDKDKFIVAIKDSNDECFSRSRYWDVKI